MNQRKQARSPTCKKGNSIFKCYYIVSLLDNLPDGPSNIKHHPMERRVLESKLP
jgi:hypothetical protein